MKPILVCGSIAYDRIMDFDGNFSEHFMPDKLHSISVSFFVSPPKENFGGTGGNIAYSLSLLETKADVVATAGNDFDRYGAWLADHQVGVATIARVKDVPTASGYIMTDKKDNQITAFSGSAAMQAYTNAIAYADYSAAIVSPTNKDDMVRIARESKAASLPFFFDPGQQIPMLSAEELREAITDSAGMLVNDYELSLIGEKTGWNEAAIAEQVGFLIVTLGAEGSRIITKNSEERVAAVAVTTVVDPTGAGDAFRGGFLAGYVRELPLPVCAKLGSTVAAYAVECYGTQNHRFTLDELKARYEGAYNESFPI
ncbi:MAG TPA: carbohydrate kinase family protein [Candidatus Paceibacterota bacterium]|nr:carbohydrate kinase family protein [Candidatus Paceibacterota bacterium]